MKTGVRILLLCLCVCVVVGLVPPPVDAQSVVNPNAVEFEPSADHAAMFLGTPVVSRYELRFQFVGAEQPVTTVDLGKPTPVENLIRVTVPQFLTLQPKQEYTATVAAIGPGGEGVSTPTDPFGRSGPPVAPTVVRVVP